MQWLSLCTCPPPPPFPPSLTRGSIPCCGPGEQRGSVQPLRGGMQGALLPCCCPHPAAALTRVGFASSYNHEDRSGRGSKQPPQADSCRAASPSAGSICPPGAATLISAPPGAATLISAPHPQQCACAGTAWHPLPARAPPAPQSIGQLHLLGSCGDRLTAGAGTHPLHSVTWREVQGMGAEGKGAGSTPGGGWGREAAQECSTEAVLAL